MKFLITFITTLLFSTCITSAVAQTTTVIELPNSYLADHLTVQFSGNDRFVVYDNNGEEGGIYVYDIEAKKSTRIDNNKYGRDNASVHYPSISADGRYVSYLSSKTTSAGDCCLYALILHDRTTGRSTPLNLRSDEDENPYYSDDWMDSPKISGNGRFIVFGSHSDDLVLGDTNKAKDIFVFDRRTQKVERVNISSQGGQTKGLDMEGIPAGSYWANISHDGRFVVFTTEGYGLDPRDYSVVTTPDVYIRDRLNHITTLASVSSAGVKGDGWSYHSVVSADGRYIGFSTDSLNLGLTISSQAIHDRITGSTTDALGLGPNGQPIEHTNTWRSFSKNFHYVAFTGISQHPQHEPYQDVIYVRDLHTGVTRYADPSFATNETLSMAIAISSDGRSLVYGAKSNTLMLMLSR